MTGRSALALVVLALVVAGCPPPAPQPVDPPQPAQDAGADAGPAPVEGDACAHACTAYRRLRCEEGEPTARGAPCEDVCRNAAERGIDLAPRPSCFDDSQSCAAARACAE